MKFRKKPIIVEAEQFFSNKFPLPHQNLGPIVCYDKRFYVITSHHQRAFLDDGDWVIMEPDNIHAYPCKPDIFEAIYEKVEE